MKVGIGLYLVQLRKLLFRLICYKQWLFAKKLYHCLINNDFNKISVDEFVRKQLEVILLKAIYNSSFYHSVNNEDLRIENFPVVNKEIIKNNESAFLNKNISSINKFVFNTGGSTGKPFQFTVSRLCGYVDAWHQRFHHELACYQKGDKIFAVDGVVISNCKKIIGEYWEYDSISQNPYGSIHYSALSLTPQVLDSIIKDWNIRKPSILRGYPSAFTEIANYILDNGIKISFALKAVILTAENIYKYQQDKIQRAFGVPVYGQYGHSEKCIYAFTEANSLVYKCSPFYGLVEILDNNDRHVSVGKVGRVVVTSFYNDAMFFIRYDTGDLAEFGGKDEKGYVLLNRIIGRTQDLIFDLKRQQINITALIFGQHFKSFAHINKWQILQREYGVVQLLIVKDAFFSEEDEVELYEKFSDLDLKLHIKYVKSIGLSPRGKYRFVKMMILK